MGEGVVVLVDGAGLPKEQRAGCRHSVTWFAQQVAQTLGEQLSQTNETIWPGGMRDALRETIVRVAEAHGPGCDLAAGSPSGTVVAWRLGDDNVELLTLCDSSIVIVGENSEQFTDDRIDHVLRPLVKAGLEEDARRGIPVDSGRRWHHHRRALEATRNRPGGWWCVHHDPAAADQALVRTIPRAGLTHLIAASDGATRAFDLMGTHSLAEFVAACIAGHPEQIRDAVRQAEVAGAAAMRERGRKVHDDLTIVTAEVGRRHRVALSQAVRRPARPPR
ncbi:protein phosphatase 2C domain-containing protein [Ornithinimicrobium sp. Y1694]|uniref:protein phosphatase 2C domain-containing protein n=1 Tax=Ornithinimicrobium sp. Y1694 TaxID=3418590 RepID=UPI003CF30931